MDLDFIVTLVSVGVGVAGAFWALFGRMHNIEKQIERHDERIGESIKVLGDNIGSGFERHREDHQEHHKDITTMFEGIAMGLHGHVKEETVTNTELKKELERANEKVIILTDKLERLERLLRSKSER